MLRQLFYSEDASAIAASNVILSCISLLLLLPVPPEGTVPISWQQWQFTELPQFYPTQLLVSLLHKSNNLLLC